MKVFLTSRIKKIILISFCCSTVGASCQDTIAVAFHGYVKNLETFTFIDDPDTIFLNNLLHHRVNISCQAGNHFVFNGGIRNLFFTGDNVKYSLNFSKLVSQDDGYYDLSMVWADKHSLVFITLIDRLNTTWKFKNGFLRAGRQRINWGINLVWNPNDIFNTYNFLDFDYEERPGSDALLFSYGLKNQSNFDIAVSPSRSDSLWIGAVKYTLNKWGYDFQFIGGNYKSDIVAGIGFAGNIKDAGWKGEVSYFIPRTNTTEQERNISISSGIDYGFKNGWYINGSLLYNSQAPGQLYSQSQLTGFQLTPKTLMPAKWNFLLQAAKPFSPLFKGNFTLVYSPEIQLVILLPYFSYSLSDKWDLDLNMQSFFAENIQQKFKPLGNTVNFRIKWSY